MYCVAASLLVLLVLASYVCYWLDWRCTTRSLDLSASDWSANGLVYWYSMLCTLYCRDVMHHWCVTAMHCLYCVSMLCICYLDLLVYLLSVSLAGSHLGSDVLLVVILLVILLVLLYMQWVILVVMLLPATTSHAICTMVLHAMHCLHCVSMLSNC